MPIVRRERSCGVALSCAIFTVAVALGHWAAPAHALPLGFEVFDSRTHFSAVVLQQGRILLDADFNEAGSIQQGQSFGVFRIAFDSQLVQPLVGTGIAGGLAIGAEPNGTLGGSQGISLQVSPGIAVSALGVIISVEPSGDAPAAGIFRLVVHCAIDPCALASNTADTDFIDGTFFLGVVADPDVMLDNVTIEAVTPVDSVGDPIGVVPAWQIAGITFALAPEPATLALFGLGLAGLGLSRRKRAN